MSPSCPHAVAADPVAALTVRLGEIALRRGFDGAVYMHIGHGLASLPDGSLCSQPIRLVATAGFDTGQYVRRNYLAFDPLAARAYTGYRPFAWSMAGLAAERQDQRRLLEVMAGWGLWAGVVAPVQDHALGPAFLNVFGSAAPGATAETVDYGGLAIAAAALHEEAIASIAPSSVMSKAGLSPREIEVLCLAALGRTEQETALALALSRRGVQFHLARAVQKLDAPNKTAAVALALNAGLIRL